MYTVSKFYVMYRCKVATDVLMERKIYGHTNVQKESKILHGRTNVPKGTEESKI